MNENGNRAQMRHGTADRLLKKNYSSDRHLANQVENN